MRTLSVGLAIFLLVTAPSPAAHADEPASLAPPPVAGLPPPVIVPPAQPTWITTGPPLQQLQRDERTLKRMTIAFGVVGAVMLGTGVAGIAHGGMKFRESQLEEERCKLDRGFCLQFLDQTQYGIQIGLSTLAAVGGIAFIAGSVVTGLRAAEYRGRIAGATMTPRFTLNPTVDRSGAGLMAALRF